MRIDPRTSTVVAFQENGSNIKNKSGLKKTNFASVLPFVVLLLAQGKSGASDSTSFTCFSFLSCNVPKQEFK